MDSSNLPDDAMPPAVPQALQTYLDTDFATNGVVAKRLLDRLEEEAAKDEIVLSEIVGRTPANLTSEMENWYQEAVAPNRGSALDAICQTYREQSELGKADGSLLQLRLGTLDEELLADKLKFYREHNERFRTRSDEIKETQNRLLEATHIYETKKAALGRDARITNPFLYYGGLFFVLFGSEALLNFESFEALPWATPAIALGATFLIGIAIGVASHLHGLLYKRFAYYFGPAEDDTKRGVAWRMFGIATTLVTAALGFVYYARSAYLIAYTSSVGDLAQETPGHGFLWVVGGSLLGNIIVYLAGVVWSFLMHDEDPEFPEQRLEVERLDKKLGMLKSGLEIARMRGLEQMSAANKKSVDAARRTNTVLMAQPRYRKAQEHLAKLVRQDDAVVAVLLAYRTRLTQRLAGKKVRFVAYADDPFARRQIITPGDYERLPLKLKYLENAT